MRWRRPKSPRWCWTKTPHRVEVVVPDEQLSLAIGRRGQNVRLASQLTGWQIDILTEAEESERRQKEFTERTSLFMEALDVDEMVAQLLASEGFADIEDVAYVPLQELASVEGFDEETAEELQARALEHIEARNKELDDKRRELGVEDEVLEIEGVTAAMAVALGENEIKSLEDLAGCATDDLLGYYEVGKDKERVKVQGALEGFDLTADDANDIIMKARVKMGWIEQWPEPVAEDEGEAAGESEAEGEAAGVTAAAAITGGTAEHDGRERRCIVSGEVLPEAALIRFVAGPEGDSRARSGRQAAGPGALGPGRAPGP